MKLIISFADVAVRRFGDLWFRSEAVIVVFSFSEVEEIS